MDLVNEFDQGIQNGVQQMLRKIRNTIELGIWMTLGVLVMATIASAAIFTVIIIIIWLAIPFAILCGLIGVGGGLLLIFQVYIEILKRRHLLNSNTQNDNEDRTCIVCMDRERNAAILPCGHDKFCDACARKICLSGLNGDWVPIPRCPICRGPIVYVSEFTSTT